VNECEAKLKILKSEFFRHADLPASSYRMGEEALCWEFFAVDEIIKKYK